MNKEEVLTISNVDQRVKDAVQALPEEDVEILSFFIRKPGDIFLGIGFTNSDGVMCQWAEPWKQPYLEIIAMQIYRELREMRACKKDIYYENLDTL